MIRGWRGTRSRLGLVLGAWAALALEASRAWAGDGAAPVNAGGGGPKPAVFCRSDSADLHRWLGQPHAAPSWAVVRRRCSNADKLLRALARRSPGLVRQRAVVLLRCDKALRSAEVLAQVASQARLPALRRIALQSLMAMAHHRGLLRRALSAAELDQNPHVRGYAQQALCQLDGRPGCHAEPASLSAGPARGRQRLRMPLR